MQHETSERHHINYPVYIRYRRRRFLGARARELSVATMEVEVHALTLPPGTPVELELNHAGQGWRLPALVAGTGNRGIELRFRDPQPDLFRDLVGAARAVALS